MSRDGFSRHIWLVEEMLFRYCADHKLYELFLPTDVILLDADLLDVRCSMATFQAAIWNLVNLKSNAAGRKRLAIDTKRRRG